MLTQCAECGAPLSPGVECREQFHALLVLEGQVPGAPGSLTHFFTVACYVLQHPDSMNYTVEALRGLQVSLRDALDGKATVEQLRWRARQAAEGSVRITRRAGEPAPIWKRGAWPLTVADVNSVAPEGYTDAVLRWARSIREALDAEAL